MKKFLAVLGVCALAAAARAVPFEEIGYVDKETLYSEDFGPEALKEWRAGKNSEFIPGGAPDGKSGAIKLVATPERNFCTMYKTLPDPERLAGKLVRFEAMVKTEKLAPSYDYYGGGVLNMPNTRDGKRVVWPRAEVPSGSAGWTKVSGCTMLYPDLKSATLNTGIWHGAGTIYVANVRVKEIRRATPEELKKMEPPRANPETAEIPRGPGKGTERRGVQINCARRFDAWLLKELKDWKPNLIRYELSARHELVDSKEKYLAWIDACADKLEKDLEALKELPGIKVAIDLHTGPGSTITEEMSNVLSGSTNADVLCEAWRRLAKRFKGDSRIYGYDLLNEPRGSGYKVDGADLEWMPLAQRVVDAIREVDRETPVIVQIDSFSGKEPATIKDGKVIYTEHFYSPHEFTHQFVNRDNFSRRVAWSYPGRINDVLYDKEALRAKMWRIIDFQRKHGAKILLGEFGCISWAPGAAQYLKDCVELFEEYGWDWVELDFADDRSGFSITSVTEAAEARRPPKPGERVDRAEVMRAALAKNAP